VPDVLLDELPLSPVGLELLVPEPLELLPDPPDVDPEPVDGQPAPSPGWLEPLPWLWPVLPVAPSLCEPDGEP
jgi:hypothetical protein